MRAIAAYAICGSAVALTLFIAGLGTRPQTAWYLNLNKPTWQPDPSIIGIAWTIIYPLIALVGGYVLSNTTGRDRWMWLSVFAVNLILNAWWSWLFFVSENPMAAFVEMMPFIASIIVMIVLAWRVTPLAGIALIPYVVWVSFASYLTLSIARLN